MSESLLAADLRQRIEAAQDRDTSSVDVPEWGVVVHVRSMSGDERDDWESSLLDSSGRPKKSLRGFRVNLVIRCACDAEGTPLFTEKDADWLGGKSAAAIDRIYEVAARLSKITKADEDELAKK